MKVRTVEVDTQSQRKSRLHNLTFAVLAFIAVVFSTAVFAQQTAEDISKDIIERQISAFINEDYETAYSFAAPMIKNLYPNAASFGAMVRRGYGAVHAPQTFSFGRTATRNAQQVQEVLLTDQNGRNWVAIYTLGEFGEEGWKITGVVLQPSSAQPT